MRPVTQEYDESDVAPVPRLGLGTLRRRVGCYGDFEVIAPLARGGMGGVYLAAHADTGERVALKVLDAQFAGHDEIALRLHAEHDLASRASHPGLLEIHAAAHSTGDVPYLVMEYLDGETVAAIAERGLLDLPFIISIASQVAAALAALHDGGVIHCDIKPDNLVVLDDRNAFGWRRVKVVDFGVSRLVDQPPLDDGAIAGTPWCMAPEQWRGAPCTGSDVYALGCVLYDLATGAPPFDGSLPELMAAHLDQRPARPSWLRAMPDELERLILRSLAKDPAHRPTMAEVAGELALLADRFCPADHTPWGIDVTTELRAVG